MQTLLSVTCPVRIESELNRRGHWAGKHRRSKEQKTIVMLVLRTAKYDRSALKPPLVVRMTRIAPRPICDSDNLVSGLKGVRDTVAEFLGIDDADLLGDDRVRWVVAQEKGNYALRIEVAKE